MAYLLGCLCQFGYDEAVLLLIESTLSIAVVNSSIAAAVLLVCIDSRASFTDSCTASKSPAVRFPSALLVVWFSGVIELSSSAIVGSVWIRVAFVMVKSALSAVANSSIASAVLLVCNASRASFTDSCTASKSPAVRFPSAPGVVCPCAVEANPTDVTNIPDSKDDVSVAYNINAYELIRISIQ